MNRGDAQKVVLTINVDDEPITENYADEIELTFNRDGNLHNIRKTLSNNQITWNSTLEQYEVFLSQEDTFKMVEGDNPVQLRVLKDGVVISSNIMTFILGGVNSKEVLDESENNI